MKSKIIIAFFLWSASLNAQVGIHTANPPPTGAFDIRSGLTSQGVFMPRTILFRTTLSNPCESLFSFDTTDKATTLVKLIKICK